MPLGYPPESLLTEADSCASQNKLVKRVETPILTYHQRGGFEEQIGE
jgi:hypothetical protein